MRQSLPPPAALRLPGSHVWRRYGVTSRTISRWLARESLGFPKPVQINGRRYWLEADLCQWELERARASAKTEGAALD